MLLYNHHRKSRVHRVLVLGYQVIDPEGNYQPEMIESRPDLWIGTPWDIRGRVFDALPEDIELGENRYWEQGMFSLHLIYHIF